VRNIERKNEIILSRKFGTMVLFSGEAGGYREKHKVFI